ncbi:MAG: nucleoside 2-deoxyribosyltransferase [bacterium]
MKSVTICSSNRFADEAEVFANKLKKLGVNVLVPHFYTKNYGGVDKVKEVHNRKFIAMGLTHDHFNKIRKSDAVFIYNKEGYSGNSVTLELGYAVALGKPVYALSDKDVETCRDILFAGYAKTPTELIKFLK